MPEFRVEIQCPGLSTGTIFKLVSAESAAEAQKQAEAVHPEATILTVEERK